MIMSPQTPQFLRYYEMDPEKRHPSFVYLLWTFFWHLRAIRESSTNENSITSQSEHFDHFYSEYVATTLGISSPPDWYSWQDFIRSDVYRRSIKIAIDVELLKDESELRFLSRLFWLAIDSHQTDLKKFRSSSFSYTEPVVYNKKGSPFGGSFSIR